MAHAYCVSEHSFDDMLPPGGNLELLGDSDLEVEELAYQYTVLDVLLRPFSDQLACSHKMDSVVCQCFLHADTH